MATAAELDAQWEAQYQVVLAKRQELTAAQTAVAQSAAYQNGTEAERLALGRTGEAEAARLAFNAENQKLTALKKELDLAKEAEKQASVANTSTVNDPTKNAAGSADDDKSSKTSNSTNTEGTPGAASAPTGNGSSPSTNGGSTTNQTSGTSSVTGATPANSGSTSAGKAGTSNAGTAESIIGLRDWNPLSEFSSYTYKISLYMMNPKQFNAYMAGDYTTIKDFQLIAQSGGINNTLDSKRAPGFELDFYIDDLEIETRINTKETLIATNSIDFKFKIYEPYGFSFVQKLTQAQIAAQKNKKDSSGNPITQISSLKENFLLTIKFYGYDKNGKLVTGKDYPQADVNKLDEQSVFERGFPIGIKDFKFKLENKITVYSISAFQKAEQLAKGTRLGTVPTKITLSGETLQDVLVGSDQNSAKKNIVGLVQALNDAETLQDKKTKNEYAIEFESGSIIPDASLVPEDYYVKERTPMASIQGISGSNERTAWKNRLGTVDKKIRTIELPAGIPIVQAIDQLITQSEYLKNMMIAVDKEITQTAKETDPTSEKNPNPKSLSWYNISTKTEIKGDTIDSQTGDYAYKITYKISDYQIPYIRALYASRTRIYYGAHKRYQYWYTGQNTEILSYEQDYNFLYTVEGSIASKIESKNLQSAAVRDTSAQNTDSTNSKPGTNEIINSVKAFLYSEGDLLKFKLKILGDPDYLMPSIGNSGKNGTKKWYGNDFSINPNSGQVFIEIYFEQGEDYDNDTGLLPHDGNMIFMNYPSELKTKIKGMTYMVNRVTSSFSKGKFEQTINGIIPEFAKSGDLTAGREQTTPPSNTREQATDATTPKNKETSADNSKTVTQPPATGVAVSPSGVAEDIPNSTSPVVVAGGGRPGEGA